jgi:hypothetical protein
MPRAWRADRDYDDLDPDDCGVAAFVCLRLNSLSVIVFTASLEEAEAAAAVPSCGRGCVGGHDVAHRVDGGRVRVRTVARPPSKSVFRVSAAVSPPAAPKPPAAAAIPATPSTHPSEPARPMAVAETRRCRYGHDAVTGGMHRCKACRRIRGRQKRRTTP